MNYNEFQKVCKEKGFLVEIGTKGPLTVELTGTDHLTISFDWIDEIEDDSKAFELFFLMGKVHFDVIDVEEEDKLSFEFAVNLGIEYNLLVSYEELKDEYIDYYDLNPSDYDLFSLCGKCSIKELVDRYGLPLKVKLPHFYGNFYFVAEEINRRKETIEGTQYSNGSIYRRKEYSFSEVCNWFESDGSKDREYNNSIKQRIKEKDDFGEVVVNNTRLLNHQKAGFLLANKYDKFAFFYDTGTGKTFMTLSIIKEKQEKKGAKFLIIAPKAIIDTAWLEDSKNFFPEMRLLPLSNNFRADNAGYANLKNIYDWWKKNTKIPNKYLIKDKDWENATNEYYISYNTVMNSRSRIDNTMQELADHFIVNIEKFRYDPEKVLECCEDVDGLVIDESALLKNPQSKNAKTMLDYADDFKYIYLLSGKPAPNNSTEYYAQMRLVDPNTFNFSFNYFKSSFFTGSGSNISFSSERNKERVANMIAVRSLIVSKDDCLSLEDPIKEIRQFELPSYIMKQYDNLYERCFFDLKNKENENVYYSAICKLAIFTKLREIASGFIIDEYKSVSKIHDLKIDELVEIVEENPKEQIIVWCQFEYEIKRVVDTLKDYGKVVTAYGKTKNLDENIRQFKNGDAKYIVAHPKSIKYGVTFTNCNLAVYYSFSYSAEDYYQSRDRIHRMGQKRICTYYFIQAENTIDEIMYDAVENKMTSAEIFELIVKQAAKHGVNYDDFAPEMNSSPQDELISTQKVNEKYHFNIDDDILFSYKKKNIVYQGTLYNTLLKNSKVLRPEEVLFEVGIDLKLLSREESYNSQENKGNLDFRFVKEVALWVIDEMKELEIRIIPCVYDYLEEQIIKQYEIDLANGASEINEDELSLHIRKQKKEKHTNNNSSSKKRKNEKKKENKKMERNDENKNLKIGGMNFRIFR